MSWLVGEKLTERVWPAIVDNNAFIPIASTLYEPKTTIQQYGIDKGEYDSCMSMSPKNTHDYFTSLHKYRRGKEPLRKCREKVPLMTK
mmetsp:Transcript_16302/g.26771  ORF Transcript_16302/g.26771 Transcript_16302/m.26771 type:complete len:88 (-) Transcript_16302:3202-3465(-)